MTVDVVMRMYRHSRHKPTWPCVHGHTCSRLHIRAEMHDFVSPQVKHMFTSLITSTKRIWRLRLLPAIGTHMHVVLMRMQERLDITRIASGCM